MALLGVKGMAGFRRVVAIAAMVMGVGTFSLAQGQYNDPQWNTPRGYGDYYHENGSPNPAARQGYEAGLAQGESDAREHHSYRPTHVDTYRNVPESPSSYRRDDFKRTYREAFVHGYSKGYGR